ncbi:MAG: AAA family ATPase [Chloroflexia bacterium]|nr:AAA family ATPase [Chloroflexia bacterium]
MWKLHETYNWQDLENQFDWVGDMQHVPQDPVYHAEGNVAIHTQMVLDKLQQLDDFKKLDEQKKQILLAAALMHDIEKRSTTVTETDGRISSAFHAKNGENTVREILYKDIETPFEIREQIAKLVRYHGKPLWLPLAKYPEKELLRIAFEVDTQLLAILATADVLGRVGAEIEEKLAAIELFKEYCMELDCWGKYRKFESELAKYHYFANSSHVSYIPFAKSSCDVVLLSALPGSGKDYFIRKNYADWPVISLDDLRRKYKASPTDQKMNGRIVQEAKENARKHLRAKQAFVWNATNLSGSNRKSLIDLFADYGARIKIVYLEVPYNKLVEQNQSREYPIPQKVLDKMVSRWEVPQQWEAHHVEYIIG